jgi:hypothetical protein
MLLALIITCELIVLIRLVLPHLLACGQAKYDAIYGVPHGDLPTLPLEFHGQSIITEAQRHHGA